MFIKCVKQIPEKSKHHKGRRYVYITLLHTVVTVYMSKLYTKKKILTNTIMLLNYA